VAWEDRRPALPEFRVLSVRAGAPIELDRGTVLTGTNPALVSGAGRASVAWLDGDRVFHRSTVTGR